MFHWITILNVLTFFPLLVLFQAVHSADRANLLDDAFNLARAGLLDYDVALGLTEYLHKETEHIPWDSAASGFSYISSMFRFSSNFGLLNVISFYK